MEINLFFGNSIKNMTANFEAPKNNRQPAADKSEMENPKQVSKAPLQEADFELLSAYLDGEVTAAERKLVQEWLDSDPKAHKLYARLLRLRQEIHHIPIPKVEQSTEQLSEQVFRRVDRSRRKARVCLLVGGAIAALFVGAVYSLLPGSNSPVFRMARSPETAADSELLMIALNQPVVKIPPAAAPSAQKLNRNVERSPYP